MKAGKWLPYMEGVAVREIGEFDPSECPFADFCEVRRWPSDPGGGVPACDRVCSRPLESKRLCDDASVNNGLEGVDQD